MTKTKIKKIDPQTLTESLESLAGWEYLKMPDAIKKSFRFENFNHAWSFMSRVALLAERMDHHPEWSNTYNQVTIILSTHDVNGISHKDIKMATTIDSYL